MGVEHPGRVDAVAEGGAQDVRDLVRHVEPDLIEERSGPIGMPKSTIERSSASMVTPWRNRCSASFR